MLGFIFFLVDCLEGRFGNTSGNGNGMLYTQDSRAYRNPRFEIKKIRFVYRTQIYIIHPKHARVAGELGKVFNFRTLRKKQITASQPLISVSGVEPDSGPLDIYIH